MARLALALGNAGKPTADLLTLAREIVSGVRAASGVTLSPEPILIGAALSPPMRCGR